MDGHVLEIRGRAHRGRREDVFALFEAHLAPRAEKNPSQRLVVWVADHVDADAFSLFEIYDDAGAADANANEDWFANYLAAVAPLLDGFPAITTGSPRWVKGLD